ncbi:MAG: helicase SNF2 [Pelodictyon luteolum]|uniref:Helicase SNF2 n=1 Tax=Pelodictyon luteolum TaxID=1100 RepID=A0A165MCS9_PELLU|nr:DEAD/DEAH box helicase [Pelodictyon luteolum]KZK75092.1 MAG: helicase SNF2 [Pelodictyon luteolum]
MIALHCSVQDGTAMLWSEGRAVGDILELRRALRAAGLRVPVRRPMLRELVAWLPHRGQERVPSSPLLGPEPERRRKSSLKPVWITVLPLDTSLAAALFSCMRGGGIPGSGVLFGSSLFWTMHLFETALHLVATERYLPSLVRGPLQWEGRWVPYPADSTSLRLDALAEAMPPVSRCLSSGLKKRPGTAGKEVQASLLQGFVDSLVRLSFAGKGRMKATPLTLHDAWMQSLSAVIPEMYWERKPEVEAFALELAEWRRPLDVYARSPFRFCFRLLEPGPKTKKDIWRLTYMLQLKSDPSLLLEVADLWDPESDASVQARSYGVDYTEFMLLALGQSSALYPAINVALKRKKPDGLKLGTEAAFRFLTLYAPALRAAGFVVMLPSWWVGRGPMHRMGLSVRVKAPVMQGAGGGMGLDTLLSCDYRASLGSDLFDLDELRRLAALKMPLVRVRGQWRQLDRQELSEAVRFLEKQQSAEKSARDVLSAAVGAGSLETGLSVQRVDADGWMKELLLKLKGESRFELLPEPERFHGTLRAYQVKGYSWLAFLRTWGLGACLADDMGLGKTVQTLALLQEERNRGEKRPVLLICPTSVINNWRKEAAQFTPDLPVLVHHGADRLKAAALKKASNASALVISSYGLLFRDIGVLSSMQWAGVILDEAQNIKNPETKQAKAARSLRSDYRIALTGTPVENHVGDLWALMDFLNPGFLGTQAFFKDRFFNPIQWYQDSAASERLKAMTAPFILRRLKTDRTIITDLPDKIEMKQYCTLTREQASLYKAVVDELQEKIESSEGIERRGMVLALLVKLKQVCNHPVQFLGDNSSVADRSGKLQRLLELLAEIRESGERTLVFTQFREMGSLLQGHLQERLGEEVFFLHGSLSRKKRDEMIETFQNGDDAPRIFILSLKAGGSGLNLTKASHVIHYDRWWNPAVENQATDRAFRIGQKLNVEVHKFITAGTLEERIDEMIEKKTSVSGTVLGNGEQWLTELSNSDLKKLVMLGRDATGE